MKSIVRLYSPICFFIPRENLAYEGISKDGSKLLVSPRADPD